MTDFEKIILDFTDDVILDLSAILVLPQPDDLLGVRNDPESVISDATSDPVVDNWRSWTPDLSQIK